ncbi:hypothetical protein J4457_01675 [Candidatus Woesearchaeota archaeon]|nr:hypothetical protein [Candidatus Woesearchaeota archaeon]
MLSSDIQKLNALAKNLKDKGICHTTDEAFHKAQELLGMPQVLEQVKSKEAKREQEIESIKRKINVLEQQLQQKQTEIQQLHQDKEDLEQQQQTLEKPVE